MIRSITALALFVLSANVAFAHPNHIGITEIEWNHESKRFEVAMKLRIADLEDAVSLMNKKRWRLESADDQQVQLQKYLQKHVSVTFEGHDACRLHWVGTELLLHDVWIYFEAESLDSVNKAKRAKDVSTFDELLEPADSGGEARSPIVVRNTALMEIQEEQSHALALLKRGRRTTFVLNRRQSVAKFTGSSVVAFKL